MSTAKIFWSGRSQAVRLPKDFRFDTSEVRIHKRGAAVILEPASENWAWLDAITEKVDPDFAKVVATPAAQQKRPHLDKLFE